MISIRSASRAMFSPKFAASTVSRVMRPATSSRLVGFHPVPLKPVLYSMMDTTTTAMFSTNSSEKDLIKHLSGALPTRGTVTKAQLLDPAVIERIEKELDEIDANHDRRIDSDELVQLMKRHNTAFTEEEIVEFSDLFYAGRGGRSVSFSTFLKALQEASVEMPGSTKDGKVPLLVEGDCSVEYYYRKSHGGYTEEDLNIQLTHLEPKTFTDHLAFRSVEAVRFFFDKATGWNTKDPSTITPSRVLNRAIFLETIAAVPGMVAAIVRHFRSLRHMERDGGMLHLFLEEANNERMHLLSFIKMQDPSKLFRAMVVVSQFGFGSAFLVAYLISPAFCHRFVGYIEEQACDTYTKIVKAIESAPEGTELASWRTEVAPSIARGYWKLGENGTVLDLMYAVRADEAEHRDVNHACSHLKHGDPNPFNDPNVKLNLMLKKYVRDIMDREGGKDNASANKTSTA